MKLQELKIEDVKNISGGSLLGGSGLDLSNLLEGGISISNQSSGNDGQGNSYTSSDSHTIGFGLGNMLNNTSY